MSIYIVRQEGTYWHEIVGIFNSEVEAFNYAKREVKNDNDDYHFTVVTKHTVGHYVRFSKGVGRSSQDCCSSEIELLRVRKTLQ